MIPDYFAQYTSVASIKIPDGVTSIGMYAFQGCQELTEVKLPSTILNIGEDAFSYCSDLTEVTIPGSAERMEPNAFYACTSLTDVTVYSSDLHYVTPNKLRPDSTPETAPGNYFLRTDQTLEYGQSQYPEHLRCLAGSTTEAYCKAAGIPYELIDEAEIPTEEPTEPTEEPTENPTDPTEEPTDSTEKPTNPTEEPTVPVEPTTPTEEPTNPDEQPTEPEDKPGNDGALGDVDDSGSVNASDAAKVLIAAANIGAGKASGLTADAEKSADVNGDGNINATDAALILQYAAYIGAGNPEIPLTDFLLSKKKTG